MLRLQSVIPILVTVVLATVGFFLTAGSGGMEFFMPHAHCFLFNEKLMLLHGGSDFLIGISYVAISATLVWLVFRARRELPFHWIMLAFAIFIVACGATHFMEVWTLTAANPPYWVSGWVKLVTAIASVTTAVVLPPLVPRIFEMLEAARVSAERGQKLERANAELKELYAKVTEFDQLKTNFFANVSHELRTPLALIFAPVERLLQSGLDAASRRELMLIRRNALILHMHVNDLLDVSRRDAGKMEMYYSRMDLAAMARELVSIFESVMGERRVQVDVAAPAELFAEVDSDKVRCVCMNLLSNAFKFAPDDSSVRLVLAEDGGWITISITDAGPGVSPEMREKIFERYEQGDRGTQSRYGGSGLGLSIAREFVEMHGGSIMAEEAAVGALFRVRLPSRAPGHTEIHPSTSTKDGVLNRLAESSAFVVALPARTRQSDEDDSRPDVLVVEDNRDMREFICRVLEPDARTRAAADGLSALEMIRQRIPDLVLTDMMMPGMNGDELVGVMRKDPLLSDVPVIVLTAKADDELKLNLLTEGAQDYVMKPFAIDELRARVRNQLQTKLTRDRLRLALDSRSEDLAAMVQDLAEAKAAAETANAAKDDFLAVLSHELRTPLMPALAAASSLQTTPSIDPAELRNSLAIIRRNIELEARLVDDLLDVTSIARGKLRIRSRSLDLHAILRDALTIVESAIREKNIVASLHLLAGNPAVFGDAARLTQVFSNLLNNAVKFTPPHGKLEIHSSLQDNLVRVEIVDSGMGISADVLPGIFDPFLQGEAGTTRRYGGLGLGLTVAKGLVEAHGGSIRAHSAGPNQGATFTVELPQMTGDNVATDSPTAPADVPVKTHPLRLLLVEDHEDTRTILELLITRAGHTVRTAATVADARAAMAESTFDLLLTDLGLPDGSGLDVIAALRESSNAPAVVMSGYGMETDLARTRAAGFTEHIVKPVSADTLRELLKRFSSPPAPPDHQTDPV